VINWIRSYINQPHSIAPLITFRVLFGFIMVVSIIRFMINGWVHDLYIKPVFYFTYYGFSWIKPLGETGMYVIFLLMLLAAVGIALGYLYRASAILFFVMFTYVELIDKTNYLNHYYFVSLVSFLLIFVPANLSFSLDVLRSPGKKVDHVPRWTVDCFKLQLAIVYIFAGIAKLQYDWMLQALPLRMWLPAHSDIPIVGKLLSQTWVAYVFSWVGALYDLLIVFFLLKKSTRIYAFATVVVFHLLTWWLFPIGMFPFIMILSTLIFFSESFHKQVIRLLSLGRNWFSESTKNYEPKGSVFTIIFLSVVFMWQVIMPFRYLFYPGKLFWTEQGYRFSWRVMLMEKAGYVIYHVTDPESGRKREIMPSDYLTPQQVKMMSTQPDMILDFAHFLQKRLSMEGIQNPIITAEAYVTLNGSGSRLFIDPTVDLTKIHDSFKNKPWILPSPDSL
jgi:hypothetical protein